jgi:hypothetical protein
MPAVAFNDGFVARWHCQVDLDSLKQPYGTTWATTVMSVHLSWLIYT